MRLKRPCEPPIVQRVLERAQVAVDDRLHVGRERRGRGALVLAELAGHVAGTGDPEIGKALRDHRRDSPLVVGVGVAVQEADRDGLVAAALQRLGDAMPCHVSSSSVQRPPRRPARCAPESRRYRGAAPPARACGSECRRWSAGFAAAARAGPGIPRWQRTRPLAPLRSSTALVATVEPCTRSPASASARPDSSSAATAPRCGAGGVLGTLVMRTPPASKATRSVNVPPTSTPTRTAPLMGARARFRPSGWGTVSLRLSRLAGAVVTGTRRAPQGRATPARNAAQAESNSVTQASRKRMNAEPLRSGDAAQWPQAET